MSLRILLYARVNPADEGGVQIVFRRLAAHLHAQGHSVTRTWPSAFPQVATGDRTIDLPLIDMRRCVTAPRTALGAARALARLAAHLTRWRPDVVNIHFVTADALYFLRLRSLFGYKVVLSVHGSDVLRPKPWNAPLLPRILPLADAITAVSQPAAARVLEFAHVDPSRVAVIPNGVPLDFWSVAQPGVERRDPIVLSVGRLHPVKGHDVLLRAFARLRARVSDARVVLAGDGGYRADLERLARDLGLGSSVAFAGQIDAVAVRELLGRARVLALPSRSEGLPLALLEAMAAGVPVVATRVGGVPDAVTPGTARLVPPEDPVALAAALEVVLTDPALAAQLSRNGRMRARQFSADDIDARYERLLQEVAIHPAASSRRFGRGRREAA